MMTMPMFADTPDPLRRFHAPPVPARPRATTPTTAFAKKKRALWLLVVVVIGSAASAARTDAATPAQVDAAIAKAVAFLDQAQKNGNWEATPSPSDPSIMLPNGGQWGGTTAVVTYALLCAGEKPNSPRLAPAIDFLSAHPARGAYAAACRCLVWSRIEPNPKVRVAAVQDGRFLLSTARARGAARGMFFYAPAESPLDVDYDHSVSQFAILGLNVLEANGLFEVPRELWFAADQGWRRNQNADGSWSYILNGPGLAAAHSASMTTAGVATLFITQAHLRDGGDCRGNDPDLNINKGLEWLGKSGDAIVGLQRGLHLETYALFTASRVGAASGYKYFGTADWYQRGADFLVGSQRPDGSWTGEMPLDAATALGLLFMSYGSAPVTFNKLEYTVQSEQGKPAVAHWDQRPRDLSNFTDWMGRSVEQRLNWQIVSLDKASLDDLHEAPILFISGDQSLEFSTEACAKLRQFVEEGGCILGNADCDSAKFMKSFEQLGTTLFPAYQFQDLPPTHPIFKDQQYSSAKWKGRQGLRAMSNGVRELMLLPGSDISRTFQGRGSTSHPEPFQMTDDIVLYCVDSNGLRRKGETYLIKENPAAPASRSIKMARLQYEGNWDPEPGGWRQLKAVLRNTHHVALDVQPVKLGSPIPADVRLAHLTGTDKFTFTDAQRQALKSFIDSGGTLIIDAAGGSELFAESAEAELTLLLGDEVKSGLAEPLPPDDPLYRISGNAINEVTYRNPARKRLGRNIRTPRIFGVSHGGRIVAYLSHEDLSAGLVGEPMGGIAGYTPDSATMLMRNLILMAMPAK